METYITPANAGDESFIPGFGRSPGEGNGNPLQYSCLENPSDGGAWQATVREDTKSRTRLSDFTFTFTGKDPLSPGNGDIPLVQSAHPVTGFWQAEI